MHREKRCSRYGYTFFFVGVSSVIRLIDVDKLHSVCKKALLEAYRLLDLRDSKCHTGRCGDKLIFGIVRTVHDGNDHTRKALTRCVDAEDIDILRFAITAHHIGQKAIVDGVDEVGMAGVRSAKRAVDGQGDSAAEQWGQIGLHGVLLRCMIRLLCPV